MYDDRQELRSYFAVESDPTMSITVSITSGTIRVKLGPDGFIKAGDFRRLFQSGRNGEELRFGNVSGRVATEPHPDHDDRELVSMDIVVDLRANGIRAKDIVIRKHLPPDVVDEVWDRINEAESHLATFNSAPGGRRRLSWRPQRSTAA